jgi:hypothetical protein
MSIPLISVIEVVVSGIVVIESLINKNGQELEREDH